MNGFLNWDIYNKIHNSKKKLDSYDIKCADRNSQQFYNGKSCLKNAPERTFKIIQNRKGHRIQHLSYTLLGGVYHQIMRIDFFGLSHKDIPTPHVHIFVPNKKGESYTTYPLSHFKGYDLDTDPKQSLINFLKYNNFTKLNQIRFIKKNKQLSLFNIPK